jgi:hypothetical protein
MVIMAATMTKNNDESQKMESSLPDYVADDRRTYLSGRGFTTRSLDKLMIWVLNGWGEINPTVILNGATVKCFLHAPFFQVG